MTIEVSTTQSEQWIRTRDNRTGRPLFVAVPSKSQVGKYHLVSMAGCDCRGFAYRQTCSHLKAVQAEVARVQRPLADGGAAHLAVKRAQGDWPSAPAEACGICDIAHSCHCPAARSWCADCRPIGGDR